MTGLLVSNCDLRSNSDGVVEWEGGHADRDAGVGADFRPVEVNDQVREAIDGMGRLRIAGSALTMPYTISQAVTLSRSPSARLRLPRTDRAVCEGLSAAGDCWGRLARDGDGPCQGAGRDVPLPIWPRRDPTGCCQILAPLASCCTTQDPRSSVEGPGFGRVNDG